MADDNQELERWIREGVQRYVEAEPPLGLEGRVLAKLDERQRRSWWRPWMIAVPVAAVLAVVIGLSVQEKTPPPAAPAQVAQAGPSPAQPAAPRVEVTKPAPERRRPTGAAARSRRDALTGVSTRKRAGRPESFPAPEPASEQERLLAKMARDRAAAEAAADESAQSSEIVISRVAIAPLEIPLLPGANPQGE